MFFFDKYRKKRWICSTNTWNVDVDTSSSMCQLHQEGKSLAKIRIAPDNLVSVCTVNKANFYWSAGRLSNHRAETSPQSIVLELFRFDELFSKTLATRERNSDNIPKCPPGNHKMNFMIDADDAHPTHSSSSTTLSKMDIRAILLPSPLSLSRKIRERRNREGEVWCIGTHRVRTTSPVIPNPINRACRATSCSAGIVRRSNALGPSPVLE